MAGADFEASVVQSMAAIKASVDGLVRSQEKAQKAARGHGDEMVRSYGRAKKVTQEATVKKEEFGKSVSRTTQALQKMGGPLSEIIGRLGTGAGLSGGLGRVAAGFALLGVAYKAFTAVSDARLRQVRAEIEAYQRLAEAIRSGKQAAASSAVSSTTSQGNDILRLSSRGGQAAFDELDKVSKTGLVTDEEARKGVAEAFLIKDPKMRQQAITAALTASVSGDIGFSESITQIRKDRRLQAMLGKGSPIQSEVAGRLITQARDMPMTQENIQAAGDMAASVRMGGLTKEGLEMGVFATRRELNRGESIERGRIGSGDAAAAAMMQVANQLAPVAAALNEVARQQEAQIEAQRQLADAQGSIAAGLANLGMLLGGEGSETQKLLRMQQAHAAALLRIKE